MEDDVRTGTENYLIVVNEKTLLISIYTVPWTFPVCHKPQIYYSNKYTKFPVVCNINIFTFRCILEIAGNQ